MAFVSYLLMGGGGHLSDITYAPAIQARPCNYVYVLCVVIGLNLRGDGCERL